MWFCKCNKTSYIMKCKKLLLYMWFYFISGSYSILKNEFRLPQVATERGEALLVRGHVQRRLQVRMSPPQREALLGPDLRGRRRLRRDGLRYPRLHQPRPRDSGGGDCALPLWPRTSPGWPISRSWWRSFTMWGVRSWKRFSRMFYGEFQGWGEVTFEL